MTKLLGFAVILLSLNLINIVQAAVVSINPEQDLQQQLDAAKAGDHLILSVGIYSGNFIIKKVAACSIRFRWDGSRRVSGLPSCFWTWGASLTAKYRGVKRFFFKYVPRLLVARRVTAMKVINPPLALMISIPIQEC